MNPTKRRHGPSIPGPVVQPALIPLTAVLVVSPELFGGVFPWTIAIIALMSGVAAFLASSRIEIISPKRQTAKLLDWAVVFALGWTAFQLIPLPAAIVELLVPESLEAWRGNAELLGTPLRTWMPLSLDPGATRLELAKGSAIVAVFLAARVFAASHRRRRVLMGVGVSAAVMAFVAFAHKLAGASQVFGIYEPVYASSRLLAPLMNENHLGGFMALATPILIGLTLDTEVPERKIGWGVCAAACSVAGALSFSRGGIVALAIGVALFLFLYAVRVGQSSKSLLRSRTVPMIATAVLGLGILVAALAGGGLKEEFSHAHNRTAKLDAAIAAVPVIASHPIAGVGRGAFSAAFVDEHGSQKRFYYPENIIVQWTSEWGLIVGLALLGIIIWSIARAFRLKRSHAHLGALAGLVAIGIHELVDFSLEVTGVAVVAAASLGAVADSVPIRRFSFPLRKLCLFGSVAAFVGVVLGGTLHGKDTFSLEQELRKALTADDRPATNALVKKGIGLHPSEPMLVLGGAEVAVRNGDESAGRWINRAQALAPLWSAPHLLAAKWLFGMGQMDQALVELREGEALQPGSARTTMCALLKQKPDVDIAVRAAPDGVEGARFLDRAAMCFSASTRIARAIDAEARNRDPNLVGPATREAQRLTAAGKPLEAIDLLRRLPELDLGAQRMLADAYLKAGDARSAGRTISPLLHRRRVPADVLRTAASVYVTLGDDDQLRAVASRLRSRAAGKAQQLAEADFFLGKLYESNQRYALALRAYEDANRAVESRDTMLAIARVSLALGNRERAVLVYRQLCRAGGGHGPDCVSADNLMNRQSSEP